MTDAHLDEIIAMIELAIQGAPDKASDELLLRFEQLKAERERRRD